MTASSDSSVEAPGPGRPEDGGVRTAEQNGPPGETPEGAAGVGDAPDATAKAGDGAGRRAWVLPAVAAAVAVLVFTVLCYYVSRATPSISDGANNELQGWDILHGHLLLRGWIIGDATYYTLELPLYAITEAFTGLNPIALHIVPALTYAIVALAAAAFALRERGAKDGLLRLFVVLAIMAAPLSSGLAVPAMRFSGGSGASVLLEEPDHVGTAALIMLAFLIAGRWADRRYSGWLMLAVLAAGQLGDESVRYIGVVTILAVCGLRILYARSLRTPDSKLFAAAVFSIPAAIIVRDELRFRGGFSMVEPKAQLAKIGTWPHHAKIIAHSLLNYFGLVHWDHYGPVAVVCLVISAAAFAAAVHGFVRPLPHWFKAERSDQLLTLGVAVNLCAYMVYIEVNAQWSREMAAVLPFLAVLAARHFPTALFERRLHVGRTALLAGLALLTLVPLVAGATRPVVEPRDVTLANWLEAHHLTYGIAQYWEASEVTVLTGDKVKVRAVLRPYWDVPRPAFRGYGWESKASWYDPDLNDATFIIANTDWQAPVDGFTPAQVEAIYGKPIETGFTPGCEIMVYPFNLLDEVTPPKVPKA